MLGFSFAVFVFVFFIRVGGESAIVVWGHYDAFSVWYLPFIFLFSMLSFFIYGLASSIFGIIFARILFVMKYSKKFRYRFKIREEVMSTEYHSKESDALQVSVFWRTVIFLWMLISSSVFFSRYSSLHIFLNLYCISSVRLIPKL